MKKLFCFLLALFLLPAAFTGTKIKASAETAGDVYSQIDEYLSRTTERAHIPALSAIIVSADETLLCKQYGEGATADTPFLLGSVSKSFTAVCIMRLVEAGKVELDAPLSRYLPEAREGEKITVRQLLNHTGGLGEHQNFSNYRIVNKQGEHVYANVNYTLLGKIIEAASGVSYEEYIKENVFKPLGLAHTAATKEESEKNGLITGTRNYFGFHTPSKPFYPKDDKDWISVPAGYLSSSASDLGKYLQMYLKGGGELLSNESVQAMFESGVEVNADIPYSYGFGWTKIREPLNETVYRHSGLVETGMSCIYVLPERGIGIAVLINANDYFVTNDMMDRLDWSIPLLLMGEAPNEIGESEYVLKHLGYDLLYLFVLACAVLPLLFIKRFLKPVAGNKLAVRIGLLVIVHVVCPVLLLLLSQIAFLTPLWVAKAFVPDFYLTAVLSSVLLFAGGLTKAALMILGRWKKPYGT